jgi:hypothetical protein
MWMAYLDELDLNSAVEYLKSLEGKKLMIKNNK